MYLTVSRSSGGKHMLAGQSSRHQVSIAHSGSGVRVCGVREQLGGQGNSALRYGVVWGRGTFPSLPLVGVCLSSMGRGRVQVPYCSGGPWKVLKGSRVVRTLLDMMP